MPLLILWGLLSVVDLLCVGCWLKRVLVVFMLEDLPNCGVLQSYICMLNSEYDCNDWSGQH